MERRRNEDRGKPCLYYLPSSSVVNHYLEGFEDSDKGKQTNMLMDEILHHVEAVGNHCLFVGTYVGNEIIPGFLNGGASSGFRVHPQ